MAGTRGVVWKESQDMNSGSPQKFTEKHEIDSAMFCHLERSEESTAANIMPHATEGILRCAQNDRTSEFRFFSSGGFGRDV